MTSIINHKWPKRSALFLRLWSALCFQPGSSLPPGSRPLSLFLLRRAQSANQADEQFNGTRLDAGGPPAHPVSRLAAPRRRRDFEWHPCCVVVFFWLSPERRGSVWVFPRGPRSSFRMIHLALQNKAPLSCEDRGGAKRWAPSGGASASAVNKQWAKTITRFAVYTQDGPGLTLSELCLPLAPWFLSVCGLMWAAVPLDCLACGGTAVGIHNTLTNSTFCPSGGGASHVRSWLWGVSNPRGRFQARRWGIA